VIRKISRRENFDLRKTEYDIQHVISKSAIVHSAIEELLHAIADEAVLMSRSKHEIRSGSIASWFLISPSITAGLPMPASP